MAQHPSPNRPIQKGVLGVLLCTLGQPGLADGLSDALDASYGEATYIAPPPAELARVQTLFAGELAGQAGDWEALGMTRRTFEESHGVLVTERDTRRQGRGLFAFRNDAALPWLLQAPHRRNDRYTGVLAHELFTEQPAQAAMWSTTSRRAPVVGSAGGADMAHLAQSYWQALTHAFAVRFPQGRIIQLHGFDPVIRKSEAAHKVAMIVSAGHNQPPSWVRDVATCMKQELQPFAVGLYPSDLHELGGTTNAQGRLLRSLGHDGFLHLEMSLKLRQQLVDDAEFRGRFANCLRNDER